MRDYLLIMSSFVPVEGLYHIKKIDKDTAKKTIKSFNNVKVATQHQTVVVVDVCPAEKRITVSEEELKDAYQLWIKPKKRLEFGKEYSIEDIENIGYDIYIAIPLQEVEDEEV